MRLVWHIAKKDLRRLAPPVLVWLMLIVVPTVAFVTVSAPLGEHAASSLDGWRTVLGIWARLETIIQVLISYVLAGALVLEDPLVDATVFWATRPIANGRLFAAKLVAALILFVVMPIIVLLPVWAACGFSLREVVLAAAEVAGPFGATILVALTIASLVRTLPQFLLCSLIIVGAFMATGVIPKPIWLDAPMMVRRTRESLVFGGVLPVMALIAAHQFLTRRTTRTWILVAGALAVTAVIRCAWPWEIASVVAARRSLEPWPESRAAEITVEPTFRKHLLSSSEALNLYGTSAWRADEFYAPVLARGSEDGGFRMRSSGLWESEAGLRTLGFNGNAEPLRWQLIVGPSPVNFENGEPNLSGTLEIWAIRTRMLGEVPLRAGAEATQDGHRMRILQLVSQGERVDEIFLEEREARSSAVGNLGSNLSQREADTLRHIDRYFVVDRATRKARPTGLGDIGSVDLNSVTIRLRGLGVTWTRNANATDDVLVKMRFECEQRFERPLEVHGTTTTRPTP